MEQLIETVRAARPGFDLDAAWAVHPQVAVRPEPFGALLYHFGTRRLSFLKNPTLRVIVESLAAHPDARSALAAAGVPVADGADAPPVSITSALSTLAATGMIVER
jgi:putative mycofactocin binding protein MftB